MHRHTICCTLSLGLLLAGCVTSFEPFVTDENAIFDPDIVGVWTQSNGKSSWEFQADDGDYRVIINESDGRSGVFQGRLTELGGRRFLDLTPRSESIEASDYYQWHLLPLHSLVQVETADGEMKLSLMNIEWLRKHVKAHPDAIAVTEVGNRHILSAPTAELRSFVEAHAADAEFFRNPFELERVE